jgi:putative ABC transport system ATP-binding protein
LEADFGHDFSRDGPVLPILGESGTGKSTLLYVIAALALPRAGQVTWRDKRGGRTITLSSSPSEAERAATVDFRRFLTGFALQDASLVPHLKVHENLEWILRQRNSDQSGQLAERGKDARYRRVADTVERFLSDEDRRSRLDEIMNTFPSKLSGGERLRMALAAAMIHDPQLLFADEPTGSLDPGTRERILGIIRRWIDEGNGHRSFIFITHQQSEAEQLRASRCIRLKRGSAGVVAVAEDL